MSIDSSSHLPTPSESLILVVDDVVQNIQVVVTMLREAGYSIMPATSGSAALQRVQKKLPDLILLDLMMPDLDGLEVCRRLKAEPRTRNIPIIFLTASNEMSHLIQGLDAGAVDYITKPFNPPELLARVHTHLELKHSRDIILRYTEQLAHLNNEKNEFLGMAAHDLRNPLNVVKGYVEMMQDEPNLPPAERAELLDRIHDATRRMAEMLQNLLDANRIERGELHLTIAPTDLSALVGAVVDSQRPRATAKQQTLFVESTRAPLNALVDPTVTAQILENLVSNAIKYSPPWKNIFVRLKREAGTARCEVQDEGPGLSPEDQKKLFGKFARLSAKPTGGEHSTGLGLSIVKKLVEAMNGKVWCESELGHGARFLVEFLAE